MRRRERGSVLLMALGFVVLAALMLNGLAAGATRLRSDGLRRDLGEAALAEARGGVRWAAARLAAGERSPRLEREDPEGRLEVVVHDGRIVATYAFRLDGGGRIERRSEADWSPQGLSGRRER